MNLVYVLLKFLGPGKNHNKSSNDTVGGFKNASNRHTEGDKNGDVLCTIDESIKGVASLRRYGMTFDGLIQM